MRSTPVLTESEMQAAEARIPRLAVQAGRAAHRRALVHAGYVLMKSDDNKLVVERADGTIEVIRSLPPGTPVRKGAVFRRGADEASGR